MEVASNELRSRSCELEEESVVVFPVTCIIFPTSSAHSIVGGFRAVGENSGRLCEILGGKQGNEVVVDDG